MDHILRTSDRRFSLKLEKSVFDHLNDIIFEIDYTGDTGMIFHDGELLNDHLCQGEPWRISLKRYRELLSGKGLYFYLKPLYKDAPFLDDFPQERISGFSKKKQFFKLESLCLLPEYKASFHIVK